MQPGKPLLALTLGDPAGVGHEIIEELLQLAKEIRDSHKRGEEMGLPDDELAFYDALAQNESAMEVMGIDQLKVIAAELVTNVRKSVSIDWTGRGPRLELEGSGSPSTMERG